MLFLLIKLSFFDTIKTIIKVGLIMTTAISNSIINDLSGTHTGAEIVPFIDNAIRQFCEKMDLPIFKRKDYENEKSKKGLYFEDFHKDNNCFFYDLTYQSESNLIALIEIILCKKINNCRQFLSAVHFYYEIAYGNSYQDNNFLSIEIRNENGYVKISAYDHHNNCSLPILFKIVNNIISFDIYSESFELETINLDNFEKLFNGFINNCYARKMQGIARVTTRSNVTSKYILERSKMSIFDAIQTTTAQLNIKDLAVLCKDFNLKEAVIINDRGNNTCYKTNDSSEILMLTNAILNTEDASFIRQVLSFIEFRRTISKNKPLIYRLSFKTPSQYKLKYSNIYNLSVLAEDDFEETVGDISINLGDYTNSAILLDFFRGKYPQKDNIIKYRDELPDDLFQLMKDSFKQEVAEHIGASVDDLMTPHYKLYEIMHY
jgi:hypothetical protein